MQSFLLQDFILIAAAAFLGGFFARTVKLPPVLGYILSGVLFGVFGKSFISSYSTLLELSQLGITLLLFTYGFEISFDVLKKIEKKVFVIGILQILFTAIIIFPILVLFSMSVSTAALFSVLFSFSSTTVVVKILEEKGRIHDFPGNIIFVLLLLQDLFIVPVIFLLPVLFGGQSGGVSALISSFLISAIRPLIVFAGILLISKLFLSKVLSIIFRYPSHELTILATIFTAAISIALFKYVGLPESIAAFLAGVIISEQGRNLAPLTEIRPLRDLFLVIFFVLTGMLFSVPYFVSHAFTIIILVLLILGIKFLVVFCLVRIGFFKLGPSLTIASYLTNIGEFAAVISQVAFLQKNISSDHYQLLLSIFIVSLISVPFENTFFEQFYQKFRKNKIVKKIFPDSYGNSNPQTKEKIADHVIICGHGRVGKEIRNMLELAEIPYVVIDFNKKVISDLRSIGKLAIYGDPTDSDILSLSRIATAKALVISLPDIDSIKKIIHTAKKMNKNLIVFCRVHKDHDLEELKKNGVEKIVFPEFEAGVQIGIAVLNLFKIKDELQSKFIARLRGGAE